ncbi:MAG: prepilin-type N-terminal cleavage/methylation domain-containing protein [bacterium]
MSPPCPQQPKASGFTLLELMIGVSLLAILAGSAWFSFEPWWERVRLEQVAADLRMAMEEAQAQALAQRTSHQLELQEREVRILRILRGAQDAILWTHVPEDMSLTASRWPSFSPFGFAQAGTLTLRSESHEVRLVVSLIGRIRQDPTTSLAGSSP